MIEFLDRPIAFHRPFVKLGIGITGALMLSQAIYWSRRTNASGYFYKIQSEWEDETGMTRRELDTARKKLRELGILEEKKQGVPCRIFYRINEPNLIGALEQTSLAESAKLCSTNPPTCAVQIRQTKTETTHRLPETTTETTAKAGKISKGSLLEVEDLPKELNQAAWMEWLDYRRKVLKKPYKSTRGEQAAITKLLKLTTDSDVQKLIVDQSIDNEWAGLFEYKSGAGRGNTRTSPVHKAQSFTENMDKSQYDAPDWMRGNEQ